MIKKITTILSLVLVITISNTLGVYANSKYNKEFINGSDRSISMKLNKSVFKKADEAILINEESVIDAITATPLAYSKNAPIITTKWKKFDKETKNYIKQLGVKKITIIGGLKNVSRTTEQMLIDSKIEVKRIYGQDRYETAMKIANTMEKEHKASEVILLSSTAGLENALAVSSYAAQKKIPILWGKDDGLDKEIKYINKKGYDKIYAIGNSERFIDEVSHKVKNAEQVKEINKYDTNIEMINKLYNIKEIDKIYTVNMDYGNYSQITEYVSLGLVSAKQNIPILICNENLTFSQDKFLEKNNIDTIVEVGDSVGDYSIMHTLTTKTFISTLILMALILCMIIRAFKA